MVLSFERARGQTRLSIHVDDRRTRNREFLCYRATLRCCCRKRSACMTTSDVVWAPCDESFSTASPSFASASRKTRHSSSQLCTPRIPENHPRCRLRRCQTCCVRAHLFQKEPMNPYCKVFYLVSALTLLGYRKHCKILLQQFQKVLWMPSGSCLHRIGLIIENRKSTVVVL